MNPASVTPVSKKPLRATGRYSGTHECDAATEPPPTGWFPNSVFTHKEHSGPLPWTLTGSQPADGARSLVGHRGVHACPYLALTRLPLSWVCGGLNGESAPDSGE